MKLTAEATKDDGSTDSIAEMLSFEVQQQIQVRLSGKLQCFVVDGTSMMSLDHDGIALASAGGGASGGSSSSENNRLDVEVKEGEGEWTAWNDWAKNDGERQDKVSVSISPEGSGMAAKVTMRLGFHHGYPRKIRHLSGRCHGDIRRPHGAEQRGRDAHLRQRQDARRAHR